MVQYILEWESEDFWPTILRVISILPKAQYTMYTLHWYISLYSCIVDSTSWTTIMIGEGNHQQQFCLGSRWSCLTDLIKMFQPHVIETGPNCHENYGTLIRGVPIYEADFLFATSSEFLNFKMYFYKKSEFSTSMISGATTHMTLEDPDFDSSPPRSKWCTMGNGSFKLSSNSFGLQVLKVRVKTLIQRKKSKSQTPEQKLDKMIVADNSQSECRVLASYHLPPSGRPITPFTMAANPETPSPHSPWLETLKP